MAYPSVVKSQPRVDLKSPAEQAGGLMSYEAVRWAMYDAPMLFTAAGEPDVTARFVLIVRAERADKNGRDTYAGPDTIADATGLDERTVRRADRRLEEAGQLVRDGRSYLGTVRWHLDMTKVRAASDPSPMTVRAERQRQSNRERQQRFRDRRKAETDVAESAPDIEPDVSTKIHVTASESVSNGIEERYVTAFKDERNGLSAPRTTLRTTQLNHPGTTPGGAPPPDPRRPHSPSARGTYVDGSLAEPLTQAQDQQSESLPHARTREPDIAAVREIRPGASLERPHWMPPPRSPTAELAVAEARLAIAAARRARRGVS